jgi:hypothetical protein
MHPLTLDDLLPADEYLGQRGELSRSHARYLDRYRRVRIGPKVALLFENRQTLWFRAQELLRVLRLREPARVQRQLDWYNRLLPARGSLQAALLLDVPEGPEALRELERWQGLRGDSVRLCVGDQAIPGLLLTDRPEDHALGAAHWIAFPVTAEVRELLGDPRVHARFEVEHGDYRHESASLADDVRQSLLDDLRYTERAA